MSLGALCETTARARTDRGPTVPSILLLPHRFAPWTREGGWNYQGRHGRRGDIETWGLLEANPSQPLSLRVWRWVALSRLCPRSV